MRITVEILFLLAILVSVGSAQTKPQSPPTPQSGPPLKQTADFIAGKIDGTWAIYEDEITVYLTGGDGKNQDAKIRRYVRYQDVKADGCQLTYSETWFFKGLGHNEGPIGNPLRLRTTLALSQLSPVVQVAKKPEYASLIFEVSQGQQVTHIDFDDNRVFADGNYDDFGRISNLDDSSGKVSKELSKHIEILFNDSDTADRVAKAFTHAIELCGGEKLPF